jgi:hypothetical protein
MNLDAQAEIRLHCLLLLTVERVDDEVEEEDEENINLTILDDESNVHM